MTKREYKYHYNNKTNRFWRRFFKGELPMQICSYMMWENTPTGIRIFGDSKPCPPTTITLTKYNLLNNTSLQKGQLN